MMMMMMIITHQNKVEEHLSDKHLTSKVTKLHNSLDWNATTLAVEVTDVDDHSLGRSFTKFQQMSHMFYRIDKSDHINNRNYCANLLVIDEASKTARYLMSVE